MKFILEKVDYNITNNTFQKIIEEFEKKLLDNKKSFEELKKMDLEYNNKNITLEDLIEAVELFKTTKIRSKNMNNIIFYYGNPVVTVQVLFESIRNGNTANLCIENQCLAINKYIVELFVSILKDHKIKECIAFGTYKLKQVEEDLELFDNAIFVGNRNLYNMLRDKTTNEKYIPFDCLDILVFGTKYEDFARDVLNVAIESDIETEIYEDMKEEVAVEYLNQYGNKYMILLLGTNKEKLKSVAEKLNYKYVLINENPFDKKIPSIIM